MKVAVTRIVNGPFRQNCYLVEAPDSKAIIIDPGSSYRKITDKIDELALQPVAIVNTHGHFDHVGAVKELAAHYAIPFYMHYGDKKLLGQANLYKLVFKSEDSIAIPEEVIDLAKCEGGCLHLSSFEVEIINTPGHTHGSVCLRIEKNLFTGDTLFASSIGRTDLPGGDKNVIAASIAGLSRLASDLVIWPGHGPHALLGDALAEIGS